MKMKYVRNIFMGLCISLLHSVTYAQSYYGDSLEIAQIISNAGDFSKYLIAGDAKGIASCYTADGKIFSSGIDILEGTKNLEEYWAPGEGAIVSHHKITAEELRIIGDYAHDYGYYEGTTTFEDGTTSSWKGKYVVVWQKVNGEWKMYLDIWNRINAPAE